MGYYFSGSIDNRPVRSSNPLRQLSIVEFEHCAFVELSPCRTEGRTKGNDVIQLSHKVSLLLGSLQTNQGEAYCRCVSALSKPVTRKSLQNLHCLPLLGAGSGLANRDPKQCLDQAVVPSAIGSRTILGKAKQDHVSRCLRRFRTFPIQVVQDLAIVRRLGNCTGIRILIHFLVSPPTPSDVVFTQKIRHSLRPCIAILPRFSIPKRNVV